MTTTRNARYYKMDHTNRGLAIIFNHEHFKINGLKQRTGTQVDCKNLEMQLKKLHFNVAVYNDLEHLELHNKVNEGKHLIFLH